MKKIAFITDVHLGEQFPIENNVDPKENFEKVLADISKRGINELIFGGDIGDASAHDFFFESVKPFTVDFIIGNHDKFNEVKKHLNKEINVEELYYTKEDNDYKYIFLDTSSEEISKAQLEWLEVEIISTKKIVFFIHHPIIKIETPVDQLYPLKNRDELKSILIKSKKECSVFCGHYHMNDETKFKNINQTITQSLSFQIVKNAEEIEIDNSNFGYRILVFHNDRIETEIIRFEIP
ncbi:MAG: metallophosphoesterase family protein [Flavobacteriales bacterium]|nr:metallophosphoesterase family protein [Flavobacteriales bacterium]